MRAPRPALTISRADSGLFLATYFGPSIGSDRISIWTGQDHRSAFFADTESAVEYATTQAIEKDVYVGCGLRSRDLGPKERGRSADVTAIGGTWIDLDVVGGTHRKPNLFPDEATARAFLDDLTLLPTVVVHSGYSGFHQR